MLGRMRFTEHELTVAVTSAAKVVAGGKVRRRTKDEAAWESMSKLDRYHLLEAVGSQVLPVLLALPDVEVAGRAPGPPSPTSRSSPPSSRPSATAASAGCGRRWRSPRASPSYVRRSRSCRYDRIPTR